MGLFNFLTPKTVEKKYKTLLNLFRRTHRTFTITKNEKCVVEFTIGYKDNLQYWSIEQYFDDAKGIDEMKQYYDFSKKVLISASTIIEGHEIRVFESFNQSENQTIMYNIVMKAFLEKIISACDDD